MEISGPAAARAHFARRMGNAVPAVYTGLQIETRPGGSVKGWSSHTDYTPGLIPRYIYRACVVSLEIASMSLSTLEYIVRMNYRFWFIPARRARTVILKESALAPRTNKISSVFLVINIYRINIPIRRIYIDLCISTLLLKKDRLLTEKGRSVYEIFYSCTIFFTERRTLFKCNKNTITTHPHK